MVRAERHVIVSLHWHDACQLARERISWALWAVSTAAGLADAAQAAPK
jgi:hypothetical protein